DEEAVRNTGDVDLLIRRADFAAARATLEPAGFVYNRLLDVDVFVYGPQGNPSAGLHLLFAGEKVRAEDEHPCPELDESERAAESEVVTPLGLGRMKRMPWSEKSHTHLLGLIPFGRIDAAWPSLLPPARADRLQQLLDNPNG